MAFLNKQAGLSLFLPFTIHLLCLVAGTGCFGIRSEPLVTAPKGETFDTDGEYRIGPLDELHVNVQGQPEVTANYVVTSSGTLSFPLVGFIKVQGLTVGQLTRQLENDLTPYFKKPRIALHTVNRKSYRAYFTGEVNRPGPIAFDDKTTLLQGLAAAGSLTRFANGGIVVIRGMKDGTKARFGIDYADLLRGGVVIDRFLIERGDIIVAE